jgi:hypothetical protein
MKQNGIKHDHGKTRLDLIPYEALEQIGKVLAFGATKYGEANWAEGISYSRLLGAALRHVNQFNAGEDTDAESGISHIAHAGCNIVFLLWMIANRPDMDNRWAKTTKKVEIPQVIEHGPKPTYSGTVEKTLQELSFAFGPGKFGGKL